LATILHGQGDPMGAIDAVKSALQLQPHNLSYRAELASFYMNVNRPDLAATEFREAIAFFPNDPRLWHNLGSSLCDAGELNESLQAFDRALRINPSVAAVHCNKAVALMQANRRDDAITAIHRAIELDPKCPGAHTNLGAIFYDEGRLEEALATWRIAVAQDPADPACFSAWDSLPKAGKNLNGD
jgi:Flp pilus assembly protein TadD